MENIYVRTKCYDKYKIVILFISFIFLTSFSSYSNTIYTSKKDLHTLQVENKTIKIVFEEIESLKEYLFIYNDANEELNKKVSIQIKDKSLNEILDQLFAETNLTYSIKDRQILVNSKKAGIDKNASVAAVQQQKKVTGIVIDETDTPMPGVIVVIKGSARGVLTDVDGTFEIDVTASEILRFTFLGYTDFEVPVKDKSTIRVKMQLKTDELAEVQVVAYGKQKKESVIGSISTVSVSNLRTPVGKISTSLAGQLPGIVAVQRSGEPGTSADFWIRGISTFGSHKSPLVLVDGIERSMDLVDPEDIESFSILKDATATAVYGVRGANGIILITTKRGKEGKLNINARVEYGISSPLRQVKLASAGQWIDYYNDISMEAQGLYGYSDEEKQKYLTGADPDLYPNVDWMKEIFNKSASSQRVNLNISGGAKNVRYYLAGSVFFENGLFDAQKGKSYNPSLNYNRYNFRSNIDVDLTPTTILSLNLANMYETKNEPKYNMWEYSLSVPNIATPTIYSDGSYATPHLGRNPWMDLNARGYKTNFWNNTQTLFQITQDLSTLVTKGLELNAKFAWDARNSSETVRDKDPATYYATGRDQDGNLIFHKNGDGNDYMSAWSSSAGERTLSFEASATYNRVFDEKHRVGGLFLFNLRERTLNTPSDYLRTFPYRNQGLAARATYSFKDRYFVEGNFGYNGSENFGPNKRFGFFPAVAVGYLISNENYFENIKPIVSLLKLKGSHGTVGNDKMDEVRRFGFNTEMSWVSDTGFSFGSLGQNWVPALGTGRPGNPDISWEIAKKTNVGLEFGLFDKLTAQIDYFYEDRSDIFILQQSIPSIVGVSHQLQFNKGKMKNQGFEVALEHYQQVNKDFFISSRGNFSYNQNEVLYDDRPTPKWAYLSEAGQRYGQRYGLVALGLFESEEDIANSPSQNFGPVRPGDVKYKDINGDGIIDNDDRIPIGHPDIPAFNYGFGTSVGWKDFDLSLFFQGTGRASRFLSGSHFHGTVNNKLGLGQIFKEVAEQRWSPDNPNPNAKYARMSMQISSNNMQNSTFNQYSVAFLRLKNLEMGYTIPKKLTKKVGMNSVRFYLQGVNLLTFSDFKIWDPELSTESGQVYPQMKVVNLGVSINL